MRLSRCGGAITVALAATVAAAAWAPVAAWASDAPASRAVGCVERNVARQGAAATLRICRAATWTITGRVRDTLSDDRCAVLKVTWIGAVPPAPAQYSPVACAPRTPARDFGLVGPRSARTVNLELLLVPDDWTPPAGAAR